MATPGLKPSSARRCTSAGSPNTSSTQAAWPGARKCSGRTWQSGGMGMGQVVGKVVDLERAAHGLVPADTESQYRRSYRTTTRQATIYRGPDFSSAKKAAQWTCWSKNRFIAGGLAALPPCQNDWHGRCFTA